MEELFINLTMRCKVLKEPVMSFLPSGTPSTRLPAVVNRRYKDATGEAHESSEYFQIVCYGPLAETVNGLYKTEVIRRRGPWRNVDEVELATLEWVHWFNTGRLHGALGDIPPEEFEAAFYAAQQAFPIGVGIQ